ncbi:MAG TPA: sodium:solute symporter [Gammaproteobacteria bacterium]|nr:sodium:solute symporter [Gammaproteobacteria bacterium]
MQPWAIGVFVALFALVTLVGFFAARWRRGPLDRLEEWGLGGRRFGTVVTWFLLGGDLYTAYTFVAVPALVYGKGAIGFFALPYTLLVFPLVYVVFTRLWSVARRHGYITAADFVHGRFGSRTLAALVAITGILATMPYIALQLVGIQVVVAALGFTTHGWLADMPLVIAFLVLAAYTYTSGIRAPALIAIVKDALIYLTVIVAVVVIPLHLGGFGAIFARIPEKMLYLAGPSQGSLGAMSAYATLALGSALALFLYPHAVTGLLSARSRGTVKRNMALLPAYSLALALIAGLGFMAYASGVGDLPAYSGYFHQYGPNFAVPALFLHNFPGWFVGIAFAAIAIGALVPSAIMSIAAANLFTRNLWPYLARRKPDEAGEARIAKIVSLLVKIGALAFIIFLPNQYAIQFQLLGGIWIIQTLPSVVLGLYGRWFHARALIAGWIAGMLVGTGMAWTQHFTSVIFPLPLGPLSIPGYAALYSVIANLAIAVAGTLLLDRLGVARGPDRTAAVDYSFETEEPGRTEVLPAEPIQEFP